MVSFTRYFQICWLCWAWNKGYTNICRSVSYFDILLETDSECWLRTNYFLLFLPSCWVLHILINSEWFAGLPIYCVIFSWNFYSCKSEIVDGMAFWIKMYWNRFVIFFLHILISERWFCIRSFNIVSVSPT